MVDVLQVPTVLQQDVRTVQHASQASSLFRQLKRVIQPIIVPPRSHAQAGSQRTVIPFTYTGDNSLYRDDGWAAMIIESSNLVKDVPVMLTQHSKCQSDGVADIFDQVGYA